MIVLIDHILQCFQPPLSLKRVFLSISPPFTTKIRILDVSEDCPYPALIPSPEGQSNIESSPGGSQGLDKSSIGEGAESANSQRETQSLAGTGSGKPRGGGSSAGLAS